MRFLNLLTGIFTIICIFVFTGCAGKAAPPQRRAIVFDWTPLSEAAAGSADVTFAVVGTQLVKPTQPGQMQLPTQTQIPLFIDFSKAMTKDFMEVLGSHGFGVRGPFKSYEDMIHPDKQGSDLILTAEVLFTPDTSKTRLTDTFNLVNPNAYKIEGSVVVKCDVTLVASESLTNERMWTKSIEIKPIVLPFTSYYAYEQAYLATQSMKYGKIFQGTSGIPIEVILEKENLFHANLGGALKTQYWEILKKIHSYLDPREMMVVKKQAVELRKRKVY